MADATQSVIITAAQAKSLSALPFLQTFVPEAFFFTAGVLMLLIHAGFLAYEGGVSRSKNLLATMTKNLMTLATVGLTFYFFGWWIYNGFPFWPGTGPLLGPWTDVSKLSSAVSAGFSAVTASYPWSDSLSPTKGDEFTGVFWMVFALFAMTTASILSGACIERIKFGAYYLLSILLGSVMWVIAAAWGWNYFGWMTTLWGFHDFGCAVVVHCVSGWFTLGVLLNLGPRIGKYNANGTTNVIKPHNIALTMVGLMLIFVGFYFFLACCEVYLPGYTTIVNIYGSPTTLAMLAVNTTLALAAGLMGAYVSSKGDPFFTISGGLTGIITVASGMDLYQSSLIIVLAFAGAWIMPKTATFIEKTLRIDDSVGAFAVHGVSGTISGILPGIFAVGYIAQPGQAPINLMGQIGGTVICAILLGFIPGYASSWLLKKFNLLRVPPEVETAGLDIKELGVHAYPEDMPADAAVLPAE
ncbi:ammonium transporter [Acidocella sp.]|uniref:ammonium transporter n=1 Tax=Acidocella sp. TaxID=50710 RepID=UPI003CFCE686